MHLILHAGQHKTGTTSIQYCLKEHRELFQAHGILVPATGQAPIGNHRPLIAGLVEGDAQTWIRNLRNELSDRSLAKALVSAELIKNYIVRGGFETLLKNLRAAGVDRFTILMYLRSPFQQVNSEYSQNTSSFKARGLHMREFAARFLSEQHRYSYVYFDYDHLIGFAQRPDVSLILRPYNASVARSVVADFLNVLGVSPPARSDERRLNTSFGPIALEAMRVVCREFPTLTDRAQRLLKTRAAAIAAEFPEPAPFWGIDDAIAASLTRADAQTDRLARFAWGKPWREVIGDERRPLNVFDPSTAEPSQRTAYETMLARMRQAASAMPAALLRSGRPPGAAELRGPPEPLES